MDLATALSEFNMAQALHILVNDLYDENVRLKRELDAYKRLEKNRADLIAVLDEIGEYFDLRADASMEPWDERYHANKEMMLGQELDEVRKECGL